MIGILYANKYFKTAVFILLAVFILFLFWEIFIPKDINVTKQTIFEIKKGQGYSNIATELKKEGIIKDSVFFRAYALISGDYSKLQAGKYYLSPSLSLYSIIKKFVLGDTAKNKVTIVEGWDIKTMAQYFDDKKIFSKKDFITATQKDFSSQFAFLQSKPKKFNLEGFIFPDTYYLPIDATPDDFLQLALNNFDKKLTPDLRTEIASQKKSIFDIVTMASIIEKEVQSSEDKKIVSGILWKRIQGGVPLQVDATVNYATGKEGIEISTKDKEINSLYNTYKYNGLPLGPISNPGLDSILAAIHPQKSDYWYYLSADGTGKTIFSTTLEEQNAAAQKYLH